MKYPCDMIQDLLPLYLDGVCSEESKKVIEQHLSECSNCKGFYANMREADGIEIDTNNAERECQKAASFQTVKKKLLRKQIVAAFVAVATLVVIVFTIVSILKCTVDVVEYEDNISVSMVDGSLIGRLRGSRINQTTTKMVTVTVNGQEENYLFFCMAATKWDELTTDFEAFSEHTLCFTDKGAAQIDTVYYFTGDYTDIEKMSNEELQMVIDTSVNLWHK